jgi:hypothetical protein
MDISLRGISTLALPNLLHLFPAPVHGIEKIVHQVLLIKPRVEIGKRKSLHHFGTGLISPLLIAVLQQIRHLS